MVRETDLHVLQFIKQQYGEMLEAAAKFWATTPAILAGIMMRETVGGTSHLLDKPGPEGRGDCEIQHLPDGSEIKHYHGHGLMQIDDRSFTAFCAGENWKDPAKNIMFAACVLAGKHAWLRKHVIVDDILLNQAAIAAYNSGEGNVLKSLREGKSVDARTAGGNYSKAVLEYAEAYAALSLKQEKAAA